VERDDLGVRACAAQRTARLFELDPLDAVGREDRDLLASQVLCHVSSSRERAFAPPRSKAGRRAVNEGGQRAVTT
jgi:hypothetical protein